MTPSLQVALKNNVDYVQCLGIVREARSKGLTVPVLLMGESHHLPPSHPTRIIARSERLTFYVTTDAFQDTITPFSLTERTRQSKMPRKLAPTDT